MPSIILFSCLAFSRGFYPKFVRRKRTTTTIRFSLWLGHINKVKIRFKGNHGTSLRLCCTLFQWISNIRHPLKFLNFLEILSFCALIELSCWYDPVYTLASFHVNIIKYNGVSSNQLFHGVLGYNTFYNAINDFKCCMIEHVCFIMLSGTLYSLVCETHQHFGMTMNGLHLPSSIEPKSSCLWSTSGSVRLSDK